MAWRARKLGSGVIPWHGGAMTKDKDGFNTKLWAPRSTQETLQIYADWAQTYEADVEAAGYATPSRLAHALWNHMPNMDAEILDFGCGTGLCGLALRMVGYHQIDGTDISPEMLAVARQKKAYRTLTRGTPGQMPLIAAGTYDGIVACGVISLGAAPADILTPILNLLAPGGVLALSYNEATLKDASYMDALADVQSSGQARLQWSENGPHLPEKPGAQTSTIYILERL